MTAERAYRIHWAVKTRNGSLLRWHDLHGTVAAVRDIALAKAKASPDRAVRLSLKFPEAGAPADVITGVAGLRRWRDGVPLPPHSPNPWTDRIEMSEQRAGTASDVKARLLAAVDAGLIDLTTAARLSTAVDLAIGERGQPRGGNGDLGD